MKILIYTNILTPYRMSFFKKLYAECKNNSVDLEIAAMAPCGGVGNWKFDDLKEDYCTLLKSKTIKFKNIEIFYNPGLLNYLKKTKPDIVICAGGYLCPGVNLICNHKRNLGYKVIFWSESHLGEVRDYSNLKLKIREYIRKRIYQKFDGFLYAGKLSLEFVEKYSKNDTLKFLLPNLIEESVYNSCLNFSQEAKERVKQKYNLIPDKKVFFCPAKLMAVKGILEFIDIFKLCEYKEKATVLIAGDGELREAIEDKINDNALDIRLLGRKSQEEVVELYAISDCFLMPSLSDPNPLSSIEALWAGLPLLVSKHVGNYPEAIVHGVNGYVFDYSSPNSSAKIIDEIIISSKEWFDTASKKSLEIADETYNSKTIINKVLQFLKEVSNS